MKNNNNFLHTDIPDGHYLVEFVSILNKTSQVGNDYLVWNLKIIPHNKFITKVTFLSMKNGEDKSAKSLNLFKSEISYLLKVITVEEYLYDLNGLNNALRGKLFVIKYSTNKTPGNTYRVVEIEKDKEVLAKFGI